VFGLALNLDEDSIGAVVLGEADDIEEGQTVKATGEILSVPGRRRHARPRGQRPGRARSTARAR
jgi:F0F1-type ATP synthase alpha subunit